MLRNCDRNLMWNGLNHTNGTLLYLISPMKILLNKFAIRWSKEWSYISICTTHKLNLQLAETCLSRAIAETGETAASFHMLALCCRLRGDVDDALCHLQLGIEKFGDVSVYSVFIIKMGVSYPLIPSVFCDFLLDMKRFKQSSFT